MVGQPGQLPKKPRGQANHFTGKIHWDTDEPQGPACRAFLEAHSQEEEGEMIPMKETSGEKKAEGPYGCKEEHGAPG